MTNCSHTRKTSSSWSLRKVLDKSYTLHLYQQITARLDQSSGGVENNWIVSQSLRIGGCLRVTGQWKHLRRNIRNSQVKLGWITVTLESGTNQRSRGQTRGSRGWGATGQCPRIWVLWQLSKVRRGRPMGMWCWPMVSVINQHTQPYASSVRRGPAEFHSRSLLGLHYH